MIDEAKECHISSIDSFADYCTNRFRQVAEAGGEVAFPAWCWMKQLAGVCGPAWRGGSTLTQLNSHCIG